MTKKLKRAVGIEGTNFLDALERLIGVDPKEIQSEKEKVKSKIAEVDKRVEETEESIKRGARRSKSKFRL